MKRTTRKCIKCGKEISLSNITKHEGVCDISKQKCFTVTADLLQQNGKYKCPICNKEFTKMGLGNHVWSKHTEKGQLFRKNNRSHTAWNKGMSKETNEKVKLSAETFKRRYKEGSIIHSGKGKHLSEERKKILSEKMKLAHKSGRHPGWNHINSDTNRKSYPEKYFISQLEQRQLWNISNITEKKSIGKYFLDFAFEDLMLDVEIDGTQHYRTQGAIDHDKERTEFLHTLGWRVYRIKWSELRIDPGTEMEKFLNFLKNTEAIFDHEAYYQKVLEEEKRKKEQHICPECGGPKKCKESLICRSCSNKTAQKTYLN